MNIEQKNQKSILYLYNIYQISIIVIINVIFKCHLKITISLIYNIHILIIYFFFVRFVENPCAMSNFSIPVFQIHVMFTKISFLTSLFYRIQVRILQDQVFIGTHSEHRTFQIRLKIFFSFNFKQNKNTFRTHQFLDQVKYISYFNFKQNRNTFETQHFLDQVKYNSYFNFKQNINIFRKQHFLDYVVGFLKFIKLFLFI